MRKKLLQKLHNDLKKMTITALARNIGLDQPTLYRILKDQSQGSIQTWEIIEKYYK